MNDHAEHLQAILDSAMAAAKALPSGSTISAVEKARKALDDYTSAATCGEKFGTQTAALEYLQRTYQIEKSKLSKDCKEGKVPRKDGLYHAKDLDFYAEAAHLRPRTSAPILITDGSDRLKSAMAEEREIRVSMLKGNLIDAAEEEARDSRLWFAVRTDIENRGPAVVNELINRIAAMGLPDDITERILALAPELRVTFEEDLAEIFDRYATAGGIEA